MNGADLKGINLRLPAKAKPRREERCDTCYWVDRDASGGLACHGQGPTVHILAEPSRVQAGAMVLKPLTVWPPVKPDEFCPTWEKRDGAAVSAIPTLGGTVVEHPAVPDGG
jgi:hypothetical protein